MSKVCVVIPTYNEANNLPMLINQLEEVLKERDLQIIVIDDNSPDGTAYIAEKLSSQYKNIVVQRRSGKLGIGSAISEGLGLALSFPDSKYIVTMDADLSHDPKEVIYLLREAEKTDMVQGSRYLNGSRVAGLSYSRKVASHAANILCRLLLSTGLHEHTTYFRVYSKRCAKIVTENVHCSRYEWAIGSLLVAKRHNLTIKEVPITFAKRTSGKSKLKLQDIFLWLSYLVRTVPRHIVFKIRKG
jgi:dolichol-phosphate mannosyltransferase